MQEKDRIDGDVDAAEVPEVFRRRLDADVDRIIEQAQAEGLQLTGKEGLLGGMIKRAVESAMHAEITDHLGYERYAAEGRGTGNSRNGSTTSTVHTNVGPVELDKPRDRNGSFDSKVVPKGTRRLSEFDDMVLSLFAKGMTTRDIAEHLELTYGASVSHETIANITDAINETVKEWRNRPLEEVYPIIYIDAIRLRLRDGGQVSQGLPPVRRGPGGPQTGPGHVDRANRGRQVLGRGADRTAQPRRAGRAHRVLRRADRAAPRRSRRPGRRRWFRPASCT